MKRKNVLVDESYSDESSDKSSSEEEESYYSDTEIDYSSEVIIIMNPMSDKKQKKKVKVDKKKKAILDEIKKLNKEKKMPTEDKIIFSKFSIEQKAKLLDDFFSKSATDTKYSNYIEKVLKLPVGEYKNIHVGEIGEFMLKLRENLDNSIYGHKETKEEIIDFMSAKFSNPHGKGLNILALQSEPGFGKTRFIRALGQTLGLPFQQISFGGMNDTAILAGHDYTYVGSKPGKIYETLVKSKCMNPILYLDECFPHEQRVITEFGNINIGKLYENFVSGKENPRLKTFNRDKQIFEYKKITNAWEKINHDLIELNFGTFKTKCTENHLFLTEKGWVEAKNIEKVDKVICQPVVEFPLDNYEIISLTSKKYIKNLNTFPIHDGKVYDIEVEDNHNFLITSEDFDLGIVVHNCDKLGEAGSQKTIEMNGLLTHLLDKEQNMEFYDHYIGDIPLDLSRVFFIVSFNNEHNVDPVVLNRLKVIRIKESTPKEKIEIVKRFTIPEIYKNLNIEKDKIVISDDVVKYIILSKTTYEKGMRNINKNFYTLYGKLNTLICLKNISSDIRQKITKDFAYEKVNLMEGKIDITISLVDKLLYKSKNEEAYMTMYC